MVGMEDCSIYGVFNTISREWTITHSPQKVKENMTLYLRSRRVMTCLNAPDRLHGPSTSHGDVIPSLWSPTAVGSLSKHQGRIEMPDSSDVAASPDSSAVIILPDLSESQTVMETDDIARYVSTIKTLNGKH